MFTAQQNFGKPTQWPTIFRLGKSIELVNNDNMMNDDSLISHYFPSALLKYKGFWK